jgi:hypothetical protein
LDVADEGVPAFPKHDGDDIKPAGNISQPALREISLSDLADLLLLPGRYGFFRLPEIAAGSRLDLDEDKSPALEGDEVDLPSEHPESAANDPVMFFLKKADSGVFPRFS